MRQRRMKKRWIALLGILGSGFGIVLLSGYRPVAHPFFANIPVGKVEIMAHGAGQGVAPTNTMLALQTATAQGADVLEVDVQLTADGVLVLHHDDKFDRTTDLIGPVADKTWAQIMAEDKGGATIIAGKTFSGDATKVARLDTTLDAFPSARWNIEIKNDNNLAADRLCTAITARRMESRVLVASFHDKAMAHFRAICPSVATSMAPGEIRTFVVAAHLRLARFVPTPAVAVQVPVAAGGFDLTHKRVISAFKARGIKVHYWTINDPAQMEELILDGADGLLTDYVEVAKRVVQNALTLSRP
jgi:glycerophosphoryl diester phosphodiesterase